VAPVAVAVGVCEGVLDGPVVAVEVIVALGVAVGVEGDPYNEIVINCAPYVLVAVVPNTIVCVP
jgi:hypothetical protein